MKNKIKLGVIGCYGKMGRSVITESFLHEDVILSATSASSTKTNIAKQHDPYWHLNPDVKLCFTVEDVFKHCDVVIDFTNPLTMKECIMCAKKLKKPLVSGTTGHNNYSLLEQASKEAPILWSANMSHGMNIIIHMIKNISKNIAHDVEIHVSEIHHAQKKDSPSGTAIILKQCLENVFAKEVSISSIRLGSISGRHSILLSMDDEIIEVVHTTHSRKSFAKGAINAAKWLHNQPNGLYSTLDLIK